ncbi:DedA family protein [Cellulosimicrobium sp. NPDC057127]|uniref:DedA family protein n=1 Tax=Cellulosimicrobium sp. NPDC057127 TaxID=3346026 RepID=UPI00363F516C
MVAGPLVAASSSEPAVGGAAGWAVDLMETLGVVGAAIAIALENLFPPLPSEIILPLAGFTASQGSFGVVEAIVWTTAGAVVGALALYAVGAVVGRERTRWIAERIPLVKVEDVDRTEQFFLRHGSATVFFGRFIPIFRSLISIPAGVERMPLWKFTALTAGGSAIWNTLFVVAGYLLGENWHVVEQYAGIFQTVVIVVVGAAVLWFVVTRVWRWVHDDSPPAHARGRGGAVAPDDERPAPGPSTPEDEGRDTRA